MTQEQKWLAYVTKLRQEHDQAIVNYKSFITNELKIKLIEVNGLGCDRAFIEGYETAVQDLGWIIEEYPVNSSDRL